MRRLNTTIKTAFLIIFSFCLFKTGHAQVPSQHSVKDYAIWGGSGNPEVFSSTEGVYLSSSSRIIGKIGSNHFVSINDLSTLNGDLYSANQILLRGRSVITGNVLLRNLSESDGIVLDSRDPNVFNGNIQSHGKVSIRLGSGTNLSSVSGIVAVPDPRETNYSGPTPALGFSSTPDAPLPPPMPGLENFDNLATNDNVTGKRTLAPGRYGKMLLKGKATVTFDGPGNYVFDEINNGGENNFVFDLKRTTEGTINIFVVKNALVGTISVQITNNLASPGQSRIYTEVHGTGGGSQNAAFNIQAPSTIPAGRLLWLGNVWVPNGSIFVGNLKASATPHMRGTLWSGKSVNTASNFHLQYEVPGDNVFTESKVKPYYNPPNTGKVDPPNNKIGAELSSLAQNFGAIKGVPLEDIFIFSDGEDRTRVMIEVVSRKRKGDTEYPTTYSTLLNYLRDNGLSDEIENGPHEFTITGSYDITKLPQLNEVPEIEYVRPLFPPITNRGAVTSQGDTTMRSHKTRNFFGVAGNGVKVGVLSDSYNRKGAAQDDVNEGDLPGIKIDGTSNENAEPVQVLLPDLEPFRGGSDEGRAMLQIVHDVAPMAKLAFRTGFRSAGDFAVGIEQLADNDCDVIVDDLTYITEPFLRDGIVARTVNTVVANGVTYFTSAGNFGERSYESNFRGVPNTTFNLETGAQLHQFGANPWETFQTLQLKPGTYTIVLQWDDPFHSITGQGVINDLDLYIVNPNGIQLFGFNRSNIFKDPFEICPFTVTEETSARIIVVKAAGNSPTVRFKYIIFRGDAVIADYRNSQPSTIVGHANAENAITVGAMLFAKFPGINPNFPDVASFSSRGGTLTLPEGTTTPITRNKPDIVAPNGVNTSVNLSGGTALVNNIDGDEWPNFFGTSAAAPHAAGVAALLIEGRKKYAGQSEVTPQQIRTQLINTAGKFAAPFNAPFVGGNGFVRADSAAMAISHPKPKLDSLVTGKTLEELKTYRGTLEVSMRGEYILPQTEILVGGEVVTPHYRSPDFTEVRVNVDLAGPDISFQFRTPAKNTPAVEGDGGLSDKLFILGGNPVNVRVKVVNVTRKYGEPNPPFGVTLEVKVGDNYEPLSPTNLALTLEELFLSPSDLVFETFADATSPAGRIYNIFVSRTPAAALAAEALELVNFEFINGKLSIEKLRLKITPKNMSINYGQFPEGIDYNYELLDDVVNGDALIAEIKGLHRAYIPDNGLVQLNGMDAGGHGVTFDDFNNKSILTGIQSLLNSRKFVYNNGVLVPVTEELDVEEIGDQRFIIDLDVQSMAQYKLNNQVSNLVPSYNGAMPRGLLNLKEMMAGKAQASVPNGVLQPVVNGQLRAVVNGQLRAVVNGQLRAVVNGIEIDVDDITFLNGQLRALVNGTWEPITNGQLRAVVNGIETLFELSVEEGELVAVANGVALELVNGQLQGVVNGQEVSLVNGQLRAVVNGQLVPIVNGQLVAVVNGALQTLENGQLIALVNGQIFVESEDGTLEIIEEIGISNGQLRAVVNGQLRAVVNGQLKAMVNGVIEDVWPDDSNWTIVNGQLRAVVNGQLRAVVNGQLRAVVNGQLVPIVNGEAVAANKVYMLANGQLRAVVNSQDIPLQNAQLQALVNGQLLGLVNGQLMEEGDDGELNFVVFQNGQLKAVVNGQLRAVVNGQLRAVVNGVVANVTEVEVLPNGQLRAVVNGTDELLYTNGQLMPLVNGVLQPVVNSFDIEGNNNNSDAMVVIDSYDLLLQGGDLSTMYALPMITGNSAGGPQKIIPAAFLNDNYEVTYGLGNLEIKKIPLLVKAIDKSRDYGDPNPPLELEYFGAAFDDAESPDFTLPSLSTTALQTSPVGVYPITLGGTLNATSPNYTILYENGSLAVLRAPLTIKADDKEINVGDPIPELTISFTGLKLNETPTNVCGSELTVPAVLAIEDVNSERTTVYRNISINGGSNVYFAEPGEQISITGNRESRFNSPNPKDPSSDVQLHIGLANLAGTENIYTTCYRLKANVRWNSTIDITFTAPQEDGIYPITQIMTTWDKCGDFATPIHSNVEGTFAYIVVGKVEVGSSVKATTVTSSATGGIFPIVLSGCDYNNPNYDVTFGNGTLTINPVPTQGIITSAAPRESSTTLNSKESLILENTIYPNPARTTIRYRVSDEGVNPNGIQIVDQLGKGNRTSTRLIGVNTFETDVSNLPKGMYFLKIQTADGFKSLKFIKL